MLKLTLRPGINREATAYANSGGWYDCNLVRFRQGFPESFGGWQRFTNAQMIGTPRSIHPWTNLAGEQFYGVGTNRKYYQVRGGSPIDVTPIRRTVTLGNDPLTVTAAANNATTVQVADTTHQARVGDFVILSGVTGTIGGLDAAVFNAEHEITAVIDANTYAIEVAGTGTPTSSGGGAAVQAQYEVSAGLDSTAIGAGWGTDTWGSGGWGLPSEDLTVADRLRIWYHDNFGEDLVFNIRDGGIFYKDLSTGITNRGVSLADFPTSNQVPVVARQVLVSDMDRHLVCFATNPLTTNAQDLLLIRWSDQEDPFNWEITTTTTAGELRIDSGSEIIRAIESRGEILVFTDATVHAMRFVGGPDVFGQIRVGTNISIIGPNAAITDGVSVFWMGRGAFYRYAGQVQELRCDVKDYVFQNVNQAQSDKVVAGINRLNSEIIWFMPFQGSEENNFYVVYNYESDIWYYGDMPRTSWIDARFEPRPLAGSPDGYLYAHEIGTTDNSTIPPTELPSFIESSDIELGTGDEFMFIRRLLPDITFDGSTAGEPQVTMRLEARNYQGETYRAQRTPEVSEIIADRNVAQLRVNPTELFNGLRNSVRLRGRYVRFRVDSNALGTKWRLGISKLHVQGDGLR